MPLQQLARIEHFESHWDTSVVYRCVIVNQAVEEEAKVTFAEVPDVAQAHFTEVRVRLGPPERVAMPECPQLICVDVECGVDVVGHREYERGRNP